MTSIATLKTPADLLLDDFPTGVRPVAAMDMGSSGRFCPVCGTIVFHTEEGHDQSSVAVAVGAFADPSFPPPEDSVYDCRRHPWVQLPPGAKTYDKDPT
jgi:hypothetical protein